MTDKPASSKKLLADEIFKKFLLLVIDTVGSKVRSINEPGGLLGDKDWANKPVGCVIRKNPGGFEHGRPEPRVAEGIEFKGDGFIGGWHQIRNATAVVVIMPPWANKNTILNYPDRFMGLSKFVNAPVFVDESFHRIKSGIFLFEGGNEPIEFSITDSTDH